MTALLHSAIGQERKSAALKTEVELNQSKVKWFFLDKKIKTYTQLLAALLK